MGVDALTGMTPQKRAQMNAMSGGLKPRYTPELTPIQEGLNAALDAVEMALPGVGGGKALMFTPKMGKAHGKLMKELTERFMVRAERDLMDTAFNEVGQIVLPAGKAVKEAAQKMAARQVIRLKKADGELRSRMAEALKDIKGATHQQSQIRRELNRKLKEGVALTDVADDFARLTGHSVEKMQQYTKSVGPGGGLQNELTGIQKAVTGAEGGAMYVGPDAPSSTLTHELTHNIDQGPAARELHELVKGRVGEHPAAVQRRMKHPTYKDIDPAVEGREAFAYTVEDTVYGSGGRVAGPGNEAKVFRAAQQPNATAADREAYFTMMGLLEDPVPRLSPF
jgi:hypothetical protein